MSEKHLGWPLTWGVREDVLNLLKTFSKCNSIRFEEFAEVWTQLKFSQIYRDKDTFGELVEFCEEVLNIAKSYLHTTFDFVYRVGAFYTLYALYMKQPIQGAAKIRLTKSEMVSLKDVIAKCKEGNHYDAVFIHLKLLSTGAYWFTVTSRACGLENAYIKYEQLRPGPYKTPQHSKSQTSSHQLITPDTLNTYADLLNVYCRKKSQLLGDKDLTLVTEDYKTILQMKLRKKQGSADSEDEILDSLNSHPEPAVDDDTAEVKWLSRRTAPIRKNKSSSEVTLNANAGHLNAPMKSLYSMFKETGVDEGSANCVNSQAQYSMPEVGASNGQEEKKMKTKKKTEGGRRAKSRKITHDKEP